MPGVTVPLKGKCIGSGDTIDPALAKYRENFTQVHHPLSSLLKKCSRIATVMLKQYTHSFMTLEILDQAHLVWGFLQPAREWYAKTNTPVGVFDLDLEHMFLSIQRNRVPQAWKNLASRFSKMLPTRRGTDHLFVAVAKGQSKDMDVFGAHSSKYYEKFSLSEFHTLVCLDLYTNGLSGHKCGDWRASQCPERLRYVYGGGKQCPLGQRPSITHQVRALPGQYPLWMPPTGNPILDG